ncbi:MAG: hypothetical protein JW811_10180 [Clostridiales bacterium]|nr:hypothetical protein [Clostridiales bacterium]
MSRPGKTGAEAIGNTKAAGKYVPWILLLVCLAVFLLMHVLQGSSPFESSDYNTYTLQAMQWRQGKTTIDHDYSYLELAIYRGEYYVSFPPVPSVPIFFLTFIWGENVPGALLLQLYAAAACFILYTILDRRLKSPVISAVWAFLICFASSFLALLQNGAVWYQAQVLAFLLTVAAIERMQKGKITMSLLLFALSVGCRPFNALYGPLLILFGIREHLRDLKVKEIVKRLLPGVLAGLLIAALYAVYNYIRFENIFEFGHRYLPEYSTQGKTQFSLSHIPGNASTFIWGWPWMQTPGGPEIKKFGFSLFLANPVFICLLLWVAKDIAKRRMNAVKVTVISVFLVHVLLFLSHRTGGSFQYGARYFTDCIPYILFYLIATKNNTDEKLSIGITNPPVLEYTLLLGGLVLCFYGSYFVHL